MLHHSEAKICAIELTTTEGAAHLSVTNDFAKQPGRSHPGTGLLNLKTRALALGGTVEAVHRPRGRFRLTASLPLA